MRAEATTGTNNLVLGDPLRGGIFRAAGEQLNAVDLISVASAATSCSPASRARLESQRCAATAAVAAALAALREGLALRMRPPLLHANVCKLWLQHRSACKSCVLSILVILLFKPMRISSTTKDKSQPEDARVEHAACLRFHKADEYIPRRSCKRGAAR